MIRPLVVAAAGLLAALLPAAPAVAHPMPHTVVTLDVHDRSITASLQLPAEDFTLAGGADPASPTAVRAYLLAHFPSAHPDRYAVAVRDRLGVAGRRRADRHRPVP
ncbi:hypothetical protein [Paractinoplanes toevensis]|uniref:Uncharacterized protein n=1 Tax=Paractinoplanes toevensis TaxID=571911 RepID=A0A919T8I0_9ACTN|nr:hypothetical protein [Actinoplanes toevensis]GIM89815.1 hypothetical protein Ato02nite_016080 [Actinoplanes toevensis]